MFLKLRNLPPQTLMTWNGLALAAHHVGCLTKLTLLGPPGSLHPKWAWASHNIMSHHCPCLRHTWFNIWPCFLLSCSYIVQLSTGQIQSWRFSQYLYNYGIVFLHLQQFVGATCMWVIRWSGNLQSYFVH
jgi:hypothetical protein